MSIFGNKSHAPTKINRVQVNQSVQGYAIPVIMGKGRVQQTLLWADGLTSKKISPNGGKGIGGGKAGTQYVYSADVVAALCNGGGYVRGIGDVWSGQSWLSTAVSEETYTITGGSPIYIPVNASTMGADHGVSLSVGYAGQFNDVGSSSSANLSGATPVPFVRVPYGQTLASGQYAVDTQNQYYFAAADDGKTISLSYSFSLKKIKQQSLAIVPSGLTVQAGSNTQAVTADGGVVYAKGPNEGKAFVRVSNPTAAGQYSFSGNMPATYTFSSADQNQEVRLTYFLDNRQSIAQGTSSVLNFTLFEGEQGQAPWALLQSSYPAAALGYSGIALVAYGPMDLGYGAQIQQNTFEVLTADAWGGGVVDCSPVQCILRVLTDSLWGLGSGRVPFPSSAIDLDGTWGHPGATGNIRQESTAVSWFAANGYFISPVLDHQDSAASLMSRWLEAGACAAFMSEGLLKLVPYGDTTTVGNGAVWVAPQVIAADLNDDCFLQKNKDEDTVQISSTPWPDAYNHVQVNWNNRAQQYAPELTYESDQAAKNRYGSRIEDPQTWDFITTLPSATFAAAMRVQRSVYIRNTYSFSLSHRYSYLEPMDLVRITTSSGWSLDNAIGIKRLIVRIKKFVDNPDGTLDIEAEEYLYGANQPAIFNKGSASGSLSTNGFADPGNTEVVLFEPSRALVGLSGNQIWIGACGATPDWGSCKVYASTDGNTYRYIDTITAPARLGALVAAFPSGSDPDTTDNLVVALATGSTGLDGGTQADADNDNTLCFVGGELVSYSSCTVTGPNQYTMGSYIRRGRKGSSIGAHNAGSSFLRVDDTLLKYDYDPALVGKTIYLKFQSVNAYGNGAQDLSLLTPLAYTIQGNGGSGSIGSGDLPPNVPRNIAVNVHIDTQWDAGSNTYTVRVYGSGGPGTNWSYTVGSNTKQYAAGQMYGFAPSPSAADIRSWTIICDSRSSTLESFTVLTQALDDYFIILGSLDIPQAP